MEETVRWVRNGVCHGVSLRTTNFDPNDLQSTTVGGTGVAHESGDRLGHLVARFPGCLDLEVLKWKVMTPMLNEECKLS